MIVHSIKIENFKSIKELNLRLDKINILIGANGAGKSNFIQFFELLNNLINENLQNYVAANGGADNFLYLGRKTSDYLYGHISFGANAYAFQLKPTMDNNFYFENETIYFQTYNEVISNGNKETNLKRIAAEAERRRVVHYVIESMENWRVYHFHDTSITSKMKQDCDINDNRFLRRDASNLAAFLYMLKEKYTEHFKKIEDTIKIIAPFFERFNLAPLELNKERIKLEWKQFGTDQYFNANHLSDGTLRMICLITLLMQPNPPDTIIIDEPELGLHPAAIQLLSSMIKSLAAKGKQIICSTQSVTFVNQFEPEDVIVVDRNNGESIFKKLDKEKLNDWLNEYSLGELWEKNVLGGRP